MRTLLCRAALAGAIHAFLPLVLTAQEPPTLKLVRDLRIDAAEHDLSPISFLAVSPNGTIAFGQNQDGLVRFFDARGAFLGTFGRKGQGPGEFQAVGRLSWIADTLVVLDILQRRFTFIAQGQKLARTQPFLTTVKAQQSGASTPQILFPLALAVYANGDQLMLAPLAKGSALPDWPGAIKSGLPIVRVDSTGAFRHVVAWIAEENCEVPIQEGRGTAPIPFCATNRWDVSPDGSRMAIAWADRSRRTFHLVVLHATGDTAFRSSQPYRPIPLTKAERDQAVASLPTFPGITEALEKATFPEHRAPVGRILVGRDETTWLELTTVNGDRVWNVLNATGGVVGRVRLKRNVQAMIVSRDFLWATETDDDGLQHIVRYRVTR